MKTTEIINDWYIKSIDNKNILTEKLASFYSNLNNLELQNLNLLGMVFNQLTDNNFNSWFICKKTNELYIISNDNNSYDINAVLYDLNMNKVNIVKFDISNNMNKNYIHKIKVSSTSYYINNIYVENIYIDKLQPCQNIQSREIRYKKRTIKNALLENQNNIKRSKLIDWKTMVSASSIRNYMLNDPCIDYYKEYNIHSTDMKPNKNNIIKKEFDLHTQYILNNGIMFEKEMISMIQKNHTVVKVAEHYDSRNDCKFKETILLMKQGVPIIYQGVLHNMIDMTYGLPDILVRSDYLNTLMGYNVIDSNEMKLGSPKLGVDWHYKVIDIKHSTIPLNNDMITVSNTNSMMPYKGQIYIYTMALNHILGTTMQTGFIWGKKYESSSQTDNNYINKLGVVCFDENLSNKVLDACNWIRDLRTNGMKWKLLPRPHRWELYPNMKNHMDSPFTDVKKEFSKLYHEITSIWNCSFEHRMLAHNKGIYGYDDKRFTSTLINLNDTKIGDTVDKILEINRNNKETKDYIKPSYISYDRNKWFYKDNNTLEGFLDYETVTSDNNMFIFMIGFGYINKTNEFSYKTFIMKDLTIESEYNMFKEYFDFVSNLLNEYNMKCVRLYHWSSAEVSCFEKFKSKHPNEKFNESYYTFYDLCKVFLNEPIVIKGAMNYSLKSVSKALYNNNMINTIWPTDSICSNGLNAMILALNLYNNNENINDNNIMKEIINYNMIDCKTMYEILLVLKNH